MAKQSKNIKESSGFQRITYHERCTIETRYCIDRKSVSDIARELKRPTSAISREINGKPRVGTGKYSADRAQKHAVENRGKQGRTAKLTYEPLERYVVEKLKLGWSPEQIEGRISEEYPLDEKMRISYEAIYRYVYAQVHRGGNGTVKPGCEDLRMYLPRRHTRRQKKGLRKAQKMERDRFLPSIEARPKEVDEKVAVGHWEGDTIVSRESPARVKSVNERVSGVVFFGKTLNGTMEACDRVTVDRLKSIPSQYRKTLTQDRGTENFGYRTVEQKLSVSCFFAHPYCSHERGANENANGLFRRYFPKGTDFKMITDEEVSRTEHLINSRPRKRLGFKTPYEVFYELTGVALDS